MKNVIKLLPTKSVVNQQKREKQITNQRPTLGSIVFIHKRIQLCLFFNEFAASVFVPLTEKFCL